MGDAIQPPARSARSWVQRVCGALGAIALLLFGLAIVPVTLEIAIRLDLVPVGAVLWYRPVDRARDTQIDAINQAFSATQPFAFNAPANAPDLPPGKRKRIAVIGDSVVWGSGLALGEAWPFKLSDLIAAAHPDIEVVSWGSSGWSTKNELDFLKAAADQFELFHVDGILVGFFTNDPDIDSISRQRFLKFDDPVSRFFARSLPNAFAFASAYGGALYGKFIDRTLGYARWEDGLYEPDNLARYDGVLHEMKALADAHGAWLGFLLTPTFPYEPYFTQKFAAISALLDKEGIPYVNPMARVVADFRKLPGAPLYRELWANYGNAHPGTQLTTVYAQEAYAFLDREHFLERPVSNPAVDTPITKDCDTAGSMVVVVLTPYTLSGRSYVRLRGVVPRTNAATFSAVGARIVVNAQSYPVLLLPTGTVRTPDGEIHYPENSFWVDLPADQAKGAAHLELRNSDGCRVTAPIAPFNGGST